MEIDKIFSMKSVINWLRRNLNRRINQKNLKKTYKETATQIRHLWYCPLCKTPNSIKLDKSENVIRLFCRGGYYRHCNFQYTIDPDSRIVKCELPDSICSEPPLFLKDTFDLEEFGRLCRYDDALTPEMISAVAANKDHIFDDFIIFPDEKIIGNYKCLYYDEHNIHKHGKWCNFLITNQRLIINTDKFNDIDQNEKKTSSFKSLFSVLRKSSSIINSFKENRFLTLFLTVLIGFFGLNSFSSFKWLHSLESGNNFMVWLQKIQDFVLANFDRLVISVSSYICWLSIFALKLGHADLKPLKRIPNVFKMFPHLRFLIFFAAVALIFFHSRPNENSLSLIFVTLYSIIGFFLIPALLTCLLFRIRWFELIRFLYKPENIPTRNDFKIVLIKNVCSVSFHPPMTSTRGIIDDPTEKRPSTELYYQDGKEISWFLIKLTTIYDDFHDDFFKIISNKLSNYHAMITLEKIIRYHVAQTGKVTTE